MNIALLLIAVVSLVVFALLVMQARRERHHGIATKPKQSGSPHPLGEAHARTRRNLAATRELARRLKAEAVDGAERQAARIWHQLDRIAERLEGHFRAAASVTVDKAREAQETLADEASELMTRTLLLLASSKAKAARTAMLEHRLVEAEDLLDDAADLLRRVPPETRREARHAAMVDETHRALREAAASLRTHAEVTLKKMDRLLGQCDPCAAPAGERETHPRQMSERALAG